MPIQIQIRRDTAANWTAANPVLAAGEWGLETDTGKLKLGDGTTAWTSLAYRLVGGTPALTLGTANAAGSASTAIATDATIAAFDGTTPAAETFGAAGATGSAAFAARRDHVHAMPADPTGKPLGLTGATAATRYVGATTSGAPISGTFAVGDFVVDQTGKLWVCTTAGTPGTWTQVSGGLTNPMTTTGDIIIGNPGSTPARLAVGGANTVLHGGTTPAYSAVVEGDLSLSDVTTANATTTAHGLLPKLGGGTTNFLRADGTWAAPPGGGSLTTATANLGADVSIAASNTWYDGPSVSLAAGTWFIVGHVTVKSSLTGTLQHTTAKLWDGTTVLDSGETSFSSTDHHTITLSGIVSLAGTTTLKISVATDNTFTTLLAAASHNGAGNNASTIRAIKVA